jgi:hypothetical protein
MSRVMVTGSRTWGACGHPPEAHSHDACPTLGLHKAIMIQALKIHVAPLARPVELIHGDSDGADKIMALLWAHFGLGPITAFPYVKELGGYGGHARNDVLVAHMPDLVLAFHLDHSPGTADAIARARKAGLDVHVYPKAES